MNRRELDELLTRWSLDILTSDERVRLDAMLREHPEARRELRRHAVLSEALGGAPEDTALLWAPQPRARFALQPWLAAAAAVVVLLVAGALMLRTRESGVVERSVQPGCAVLAQAVNVEWHTAPLATGSELVAGPVRLKSGIARLEFFSGASVTIEGDAALDLRSPWEAQLAHGKVRVHVPPAAKGFTMLTPQGKVVDLGTEYGLDVAANGSAAELHVFDGEVELHRAGVPIHNLRQGEGVVAEQARVTTLASVAPVRFPDSHKLDSLRRERDAERLGQWWKSSMKLRRDARLVAYYPFKRFEGEWARTLFNRTEPASKQRNGGIVGANWTQGRWPEKEALEFKRPGDRVRMNLDGTFSAITFACWVKVDALDRKYNSLLLTDGYESGEPHWQIFENGSLMFSIAYYPDNGAKGAKAKFNQMYFSKPVITSSSLGRWHHLAVTYDNQTGAAVQYFDGREVGREVSPLHQPGRPIRFGPCEIGNWGLPTQGHQFPVRNLNGAIDEFAIYSAALGPGEIRDLYENGKPE